MPNTLAGVEQFVSLGTASVTAGGTTAPLAGTVETWTLSGSSLPPANSAGTPPAGFYIADTLQPSEVILVTNISGTTVTVVRGADGTIPVAHTPTFTVIQVAAGASMRGLQPSGLNVVAQFGADPTGATASDSALAAAFSALGTTSGVIRVPSGTYRLNTGWTLSLADTQQVIVACDAGVVFDYHGTGDCIRMVSAATSVFSRGSGIIGFPRILGTNATAGAAGLHVGDITQLRLDIDVEAFTGTGSIGVHFDNTIGWTEQALVRVFASNCTSHVVFDVSGATTSTGSYERGVFDLYVNAQANQDGVVFQNGAFLASGRLGIYGNFLTSASAVTNAVLRLTGAAPAGHPVSSSAIQSCVLNFGCESDGGLANAARTIVSAGGSNNITRSAGVLDFSLGGAFAASSIAGAFQYWGPVFGDATLYQEEIYGRFDQGALGTGGTISPFKASVVSIAPTANITGVIISAGSATRDGQRLTVINNSAFTVTFAAAATSNVADGVSDVIPALTARVFTWHNGAAMWFRAA